MKSLRFLGVCLVMLFLLSAVAGCKRSSVPVYVKVSGKVVDAQGKPVPTLIIRFFPTENMEWFEVAQNQRGAPSAVSLNCPVAIGNKDGTFALGMSGGDIEGAPPGKYRVMLTGSKEQNRKIPLKYQDPATPLEITIPNHDVSNLILKIE